MSPLAGLAGKGHHMAGLVDTITLPELTPLVAAEAGAALESNPRLVYTWAGPPESALSLVSSYRPSDGGAPRLVADLGAALGVWDTGTGAFLQALQAPGGGHGVRCLTTYQRASDGRPRVAAVFGRGRFGVWDGDGFQVLHVIKVDPEGRPVRCLAAYEDPTSGSTRLVSG
jgi:hypothetical protein